MAHRASWTSPSGAALRLAGLAVLAFAGLRVVALPTADAWAHASPRAALRLVPGHPVALHTQAEQALADGEPARARALAMRLLSAEPADGSGFRLVALADAAMDRRDAARRAMGIAAARAPRDLAARGWLAEDAIARGDHDAALAELDAVMRLSPMHVDLLVPILAGLAGDPLFDAALRRAMAAEPRWAPMLRDHLARRAGAGATPAPSAAAAVAATRLAHRIATLEDPRGPVPAGR